MKPTLEKNAAKSELRYKGVRKRKWGKYVSEIRLPNSRERIWLGSYDTAEKAARAFDAAMFCLRGRNASFNFPDNPPEITGGQSLTPAEIQVVAARFANEAPSAPEKETSSDYMSPSSGSDGGFQTDSDLTVDWSSFLDALAPPEVQTSGSRFGAFAPEFDDLSGHMVLPPAEFDFDAENGLSQQSSFLWNF